MTMVGLKCPRRALTGEGPVEVRCTYECNRFLTPCVKKFCLSAEEGRVLEARGALRARGNCVEASPGSGRGELVLELNPGVHNLGGQRVEVIKLKAYVEAEELYYGIPSDVLVRVVRKPPGEVSLRLYGQTLDLEVEGELVFSTMIVPVEPEAEACVSDLCLPVEGPRPEEPFELLSSEVRSSSLVIDLIMKVDDLLELSLREGVRYRGRLGKGKHKVIVPLTFRLPFSRRASVEGSLKVGAFVKRFFVEGEVSPSVKPALFDVENKVLWALKKGEVVKIGSELIEMSLKKLWERDLIKRIRDVDAKGGLIAVATEESFWMLDFGGRALASGGGGKKGAAVGKGLIAFSTEADTVELRRPTGELLEERYVGKAAGSLAFSKTLIACDEECFAFEGTFVPLRGKAGKICPWKEGALVPIRGPNVVAYFDGKGLEVIAKTSSTPLAVSGKAVATKRGLEVLGKGLVWEGSPLDVSAFGNLAFVADSGARLAVVDLRGTELFSLYLPYKPVAVSWDGNLLVAGLESGKLLAFEAAPPEALFLSTELPESLRDERTYEFITKNYERLKGCREGFLKELRGGKGLEEALGACR